MNKGKFIVLYGVNNLGKTTQAKLLTERLQNLNRQVKYLKYPIYELEPTGVMLDEYLRQGNPYELSPREAQIFYALNRHQYEPILASDIEYGIDIVAEDYLGTGLAWGLGAGVNKKFLERINQYLLSPDMSILLQGQRFMESLEPGHAHEQNQELIAKVAQAHDSLAREYSWQKVNANQPIEQVSADIWQLVQNYIQ